MSERIQRDFTEKRRRAMEIKMVGMPTDDLINQIRGETICVMETGEFIGRRLKCLAEALEDMIADNVVWQKKMEMYLVELKRRRREYGKMDMRKGGGSKPLTLSRTEWIGLIRRTGGNQSEIARTLDCSTTIVGRSIKEMKLTKIVKQYKNGK